MTLPFDLQPTLQNEYVKIQPLRPGDLDTLYQVAADPLIWDQHPDKNRYEREVFETFFNAAIESGGAFLAFNNQSNEVIGSSRYYEYDPEKNSVAIGYTFIARACWGAMYNRALKTLMLDHAFQFVDNVLFHIGEYNMRSQKAVEKLGAEKLSMQEIKYFAGQPVTHLIYLIRKENWRSRK